MRSEVHAVAEVLAVVEVHAVIEALPVIIETRAFFLSSRVISGEPACAVLAVSVLWAGRIAFENAPCL